MTRHLKPLSFLLSGALLSGAALMAQGAASGQTVKAPAAKTEASAKTQTTVKAPAKTQAAVKAPAKKAVPEKGAKQGVKVRHRVRKGAKKTVQAPQAPVKATHS